MSSTGSNRLSGSNKGLGLPMATTTTPRGHSTSNPPFPDGTAATATAAAASTTACCPTPPATTSPFANVVNTAILGPPVHATPPPPPPPQQPPPQPQPPPPLPPAIPPTTSSSSTSSFSPLQGPSVGCEPSPSLLSMSLPPALPPPGVPPCSSPPLSALSERSGRISRHPKSASAVNLMNILKQGDANVTNALGAAYAAALAGVSTKDQSTSSAIHTQSTPVIPSSLSCSPSQPSSLSIATTPVVLPLPPDVSEADIVAAINSARESPNSFSGKLLEAVKSQTADKLQPLSFLGIFKPLPEGVPHVRVALEFLRGTPPVPPVKLSQQLSDLAKARAAEFLSPSSEYLSPKEVQSVGIGVMLTRLSVVSAVNLVMQWAVDASSPNFESRSVLFNPSYQYIGFHTGRFGKNNNNFIVVLFSSIPHEVFKSVLMDSAVLSDTDAEYKLDFGQVMPPGGTVCAAKIGDSRVELRFDWQELSAFRILVLPFQIDAKGIRIKYSTEGRVILWCEKGSITASSTEAPVTKLWQDTLGPNVAPAAPERVLVTTVQSGNLEAVAVQVSPSRYKTLVIAQSIQRNGQPEILFTFKHEAPGRDEDGEYIDTVEYNVIVKLPFPIHPDCTKVSVVNGQLVIGAQMKKSLSSSAVNVGSLREPILGVSVL
ncbi:hypothetical protein Pelo_7806 [Pelomyxa schiedti]|nr:hypothetical protein Pelo_7806 [Pelomyxa schiedti]